jgi:SsrA-binding protein
MAQLPAKPPVVIRNNRAHHEYTIEDTLEAGLVLQGTEIKAIRQGKANIADSFVRFDKGKPWLWNAHIEEYQQGGKHFNHVPKRPRLLLLNRQQINRLSAIVAQQGYTLIPLRIYFKKALAKVAIAVCKGKQLHDKRQALKAKEAQRQVDRYVKYAR